MPAPAVIPAPIAYINAAAVKGFVVAFGERALCQLVWHVSLISVQDGTGALRMPIRWRKLSADEVDITHATHVMAARRFYCEENSVFKAAVRLA